jgi:hypothetical protein
VKQNTIPARGHVPGEEATCTTAQICIECNSVLAPAKGHADDDKNFICDICATKLCTVHTEEVIPGMAATCERTGLTEGKKCSNCGEILQAQEVIPVADHSYGKWIEVTAPTFEDAGLEERICGGCNRKEQREIAKLEPAPTDPTKPSVPDTTDPAPTDPAPSEPVPTEPQPTHPSPSDPEPTAPTNQPTNPITPDIDTPNQRNPMAVVVIMVVVVGIGGSAVFIVLRKNKKQ